MNCSKKLFSIVGIVLVLAFVSAGVAYAITWGEPDADAHPHVGIVYFELPSGIWRCTGTLLSPTLLLTAGHCTAEYGVSNINTWVSFEPEIEFPPDLDLDDDEAFKAYLDANFIKAKEAIPHPSYADYSEFPNTYDVGVVLLNNEDAIMLDDYGELPPLGLLDSLTRGQGRKDRGFTAVGYGLQGYIPSAYSAMRARYRGKVSLIEVRSAYNGDQQSAKFTNNPGKGNGSGGTCFGDSGGPLFHGDTNVIGAIVSWGITPCIGVDYQFRIDTPTAQDFILPYLEE
jgi:hypothetical protein